MVAALGQEAAQQRLDAVKDAGGCIAAAARKLGMKAGTLREWLASYRGNHAATAPPAPIEAHDSRFWRAKAQRQEKEIEALHRMIESLGGIRQIPVRIPEWVRPAPGARRKSILIVHSSDWHMGETAKAAALQGVNEFNSEICARRLQRLAHAACEIGARWQTDTEPQGVLFTMAGDLISGDIHEEFLRTNDLTSHEQVRASVEVACAMIRTLLQVAGRVHVVVVPGNHGRTTHKPTAKLYAELSYDVMIGAMVADHFRDDARVTFQATAATDQFVPLFGWRFMVTHGDKMGTGGGQGFAGPVLPIARGVHKTLAQQHSLGQPVDMILMGHYHTSLALPNALANGSVPGWTEYGRDLRGGTEPPKQWVALVTERWKLRERLDVQLEDQPMRIKPRVRAVAA